MRKTLGRSVTPITIEDMEALAMGVGEVRHELFRVGWNIRWAQTHMPRIAPGGESAESALR